MSRKTKPFSVYPDDTIRSKLQIIACESDRPPSRVALRFIRAGVRRWERRRVSRPLQMS